MADFPPNRCVRETYRRLARSDCRCMNAGAVQHEGKWYCWTHNPLIPDVPAVEKMDAADPLRLAVQYIRQAMGQMKHTAPRLRAERAIEACERVGAELSALRSSLEEARKDSERLRAGYAYLFYELGFPLRHRWGGDANEFREGILECADRAP